MACAPDGRSVVVQSQPASNDASFFTTRWQLWRVGLDGSRRQLTSPPAHYADESPRFSRDGRTIVFVRSRQGRGQVYALRGRKLTGPLLSLGYRVAVKPVVSCIPSRLNVLKPGSMNVTV